MEFLSTAFIFIWVSFSVVIGESREYIYVPQFMKAVDAEDYCIITYNTHLATVETWKQNRYIRDTCSPPGAYNTTGCGSFINNCACWIGLTSANKAVDTSRAAWTWLDGTTIYDYEGGSFENWAGARDAPEFFSLPNDRHGEQGCVVVYKGAQRVCEKLCGIPRGNGTALDRVSGTAEDGIWDDRRCNGSSAQMHFFCNAPKCNYNVPCTQKTECCDVDGITCSHLYKGSEDKSDKGCCILAGHACQNDDQCCKKKKVCYEGICTSKSTIPKTANVMRYWQEIHEAIMQKVYESEVVGSFKSIVMAVFVFIFGVTGVTFSVFYNYYKKEILRRCGLFGILMLMS